MLGVIAGFLRRLLCQSLRFRIFNNYFPHHFPTVSSVNNYYFLARKPDRHFLVFTSVRREAESSSAISRTIWSIAEISDPSDPSSLRSAVSP